MHPNILSFMTSSARSVRRRFAQAAPVVFVAAAVLAFGSSPQALALDAFDSGSGKLMSSYVGMGTETGTPSGDVMAAIKPKLRSMEIPAVINEIEIRKEDFFPAPVTAGFDKPVRIGVRGSLAFTPYAKWLKFTVEEIEHAFARKVDILWLDDNSLALGVQSRQLDFVLTDIDKFLLAQRAEDMEILTSFRPLEAERAEEAQAGVIFLKKDNPLVDEMRRAARGSLSDAYANGKSLRDAKKTEKAGRIDEKFSEDHLREDANPEKNKGGSDSEEFFGRGGLLAGSRDLEAPKRVPVGLLIGKPIAALNPESLSGWLAPVAFLQKQGMQASKLVSSVTFYGNSPESVLNAVLTNTADIGFLPSCYLEEFERAGRVQIAEDLHVINGGRRDALCCIHSTATYPGWVFAARASLDPGIKKAMSALLYAMNNHDYGGEWTLPALNRSVYDMFYELKIGPYADLASWSMERFMREHAEVLALSLLGTFLVIFYVVSLSVLVRRKTTELRTALEERDLIEAEAAQSRAHIANLERTGIVGQMSTIIAHELKQPLSAIMNYANGLHRRTQKGRFDQESYIWALEEIVNEAERASEIVNRVRAYAKHDYPPRKVTDLADVISNAITTFRRSRQTNAEIIVRVNRHSMAEVDAWEIELAVLNLLKNAADAISGVQNPRIEVSLNPIDPRTWALSVADNGPYISDEQLALFFKPLQTSKGAKGLGLGLSIVGNIAERHAGRTLVERNGARGVKITLTLPRISEDAEDDKDIAKLMLPPKLSVLSGEEPTRTNG